MTFILLPFIMLLTFTKAAYDIEIGFTIDKHLVCGWREKAITHCMGKRRNEFRIHNMEELGIDFGAEVRVIKRNPSSQQEDILTEAKQHIVDNLKLDIQPNRGYDESKVQAAFKDILKRAETKDVLFGREVLITLNLDRMKDLIKHDTSHLIKLFLHQKQKAISVEFKKNEWQEDSAVTRCNLCTAKFTFYKRRHHCRACGQIFCSRCAPAKARSKDRICEACESFIEGKMELQRKQEERGAILSVQ